MVWGHVHQQHDSRRGAVCMLGTPSTCAQFLPHSERFAIDAAPPAYRFLELRADGNIDTAVMQVEAPGAELTDLRRAGA